MNAEISETIRATTLGLGMLSALAAPPAFLEHLNKLRLVVHLCALSRGRSATLALTAAADRGFLVIWVHHHPRVPQSIP